MEIWEKCIHCKDTTEVANCTFKDCVLNFGPGFRCCHCHKPTLMATGRVGTDGEASQDGDPCPGPGRIVEREGGMLEVQTRNGVVWITY